MSHSSPFFHPWPRCACLRHATFYHRILTTLVDQSSLRTPETQVVARQSDQGVKCYGQHNWTWRSGHWAVRGGGCKQWRSNAHVCIDITLKAQVIIRETKCISRSPTDNEGYCGLRNAILSSHRQQCSHPDFKRNQKQGCQSTRRCQGTKTVDFPKYQVTVEKSSLYVLKSRFFYVKI